MLDDHKSPQDLTREIAMREKGRRRRLGFTQPELAAKAGVSVGSLRRFEQTGSIALESLVRLSRALDCEEELDALFSKPAYRSIQEVVDERENQNRRR